MSKKDIIQALCQFSESSEYFLQVTIGISGNIVSANSNFGLLPASDDQRTKQIYFGECFLPSDWENYEMHRTEAWKKSQKSFTIDLNKINQTKGYPELTRWEFFFGNEEGSECFGIGHLIALSPAEPLGLEDIFDQNSNQKELLDSLLEDQLMGFWEYDLHTKVDSLSQGIGQMLGYSEEEISSGDKIIWQDHIHPEDLPGLLGDMSAYLKTSAEHPFRKEFRIYSRTNQIIWALGFGKTIHRSKQGLPEKLLGCIVDISERKSQEIWMKEHQHFLKELAFEQSHSLRARVANILGVLDLVDVDSINGETRKLIRLLKDETKLLDQSLKKSIKESVAKNKSIATKFS